MAMPADILSKVSYHAVYDASILDALRYARDNGFAGIQAAIEMPHLSFARIGASEKRHIREFCRNNGMYLCLHGYDDMASLFESEPCLRRGIMDHFAAMFDFAVETDARLITLHCGSVPHFRTDTEPEQTLPDESHRLYRQSLAENLAELTRLNNGRLIICIENNRLNLIICEVLQPYISDGRLFLCWDLAKEHMARVAGDSLSSEFIRRNISAVRQVHIHDVSGSRSHKVLGSGNVAFAEYLSMLPDGVVQDYCFEVRPREKARECLENIRKMLCVEGASRA